MSDLETAARARALLKAAARRAAEAGVPPDVIVADALDGIATAVTAHARSGR